jgi:hypothetical protein
MDAADAKTRRSAIEDELNRLSGLLHRLEHDAENVKSEIAKRLGKLDLLKELEDLVEHKHDEHHAEPKPEPKPKPDPKTDPKPAG